MIRLQRANPTPKEWPATHTLLLPYLFAIDFNASKAHLNLTEPFKLSQARKRRSSSMSLLIVGLLCNVPLIARTVIGTPLGLMRIKSDKAVILSHSRIAPNMDPSLSSTKVYANLYFKGIHHLGVRAFSSILFSCLLSSSKQIACMKQAITVLL